MRIRTLKIDDWETARPEEMGLDAAKLNASDRPNLHAIVVVWHGTAPLVVVLRIGVLQAGAIRHSCFPTAIK